MDLNRMLQELSQALNAENGARDRLRNSRQFIINACQTALAIEPALQLSLPAVVRLAAASPDRSARRDCAVMLLHALAVPGLVPTGSYVDVCMLVEEVLRAPLLRCGYPFGGPLEEKLRVLERLHTTIAELMEPLQPTFPNWQGLYAG
jgi:hypothetical protein